MSINNETKIDGFINSFVSMIINYVICMAIMMFISIIVIYTLQWLTILQTMNSYMIFTFNLCNEWFGVDNGTEIFNFIIAIHLMMIWFVIEWCKKEDSTVDILKNESTEKKDFR